MVIDPTILRTVQRSENISGSAAALGVLMGHTFSRNTGRAWRLRKRSMELWPEWVQELTRAGLPLDFKKPFIRIAKTEQEGKFLKNLLETRQHLGIERVPPELEYTINQIVPTKKYGAILSRQDGHINPIRLQECIKSSLQASKVELIPDKVKLISRNKNTSEPKWIVQLDNGEQIKRNTLIIAASIQSQNLIKPLGHEKPLIPIIGQGIEIEIESGKLEASRFPAVLNINNINLIPQSNNTFLIGASIEESQTPSKHHLNQLLSLNGISPYWIEESSIKNTWHGVRAKPLKQAAPILEKLEEGLIISTGHYRNGILLLPACAEIIGSFLRK